MMSEDDLRHARLSMRFLFFIALSAPLFAKPPSIEEGRGHWAFQPLSEAKPPAVKNTAWPKNDLDRFVLAELEKNGHAPAPEADPATLIRRVTLDLTGLLPTPEEVSSFILRPSSFEPGLCNGVGERRRTSLDLLEDGVHPGALLAWQ